ncbi:MAG: hypothetical protein O7I93_15835, partial [Gemmatimonadetes bacterium]|nr:hypothetical protein [Gemmatimonadota bacterium]
MTRRMIAIVGLMAAGSGAWYAAAAQVFTIGAHGVAVTHIEVDENLRATGIGYGAMFRLRLGRLALEGVGYRASMDSDDGALIPFTLLEGNVRLLYEVTPMVAAEVGFIHRAVDPEFAAQDVGSFTVGLRAKNQLTRIAAIQVRAAYFVAPRFSGGGTAPVAFDLGLGTMIGPDNGHWRLHFAYDFQRLDRQVND